MHFTRRRIHFAKMSAGGNDFVLLDNRDRRVPKDYRSLARKLCKRKFGIGADGLLILENYSTGNFRMIYYNADGSRASMCGNGARCIAFFAYQSGAAPWDMKFVTDAGLYRAQVNEKDVKLYMRKPVSLRLDQTLALNGKEVTYGFADTGVPHAVLAVKKVSEVNVADIGRQIRFHRVFKPAGTNVNFIQKKNNHMLYVRTYERGVEDETSACGTGVTASSIIATLKGFVRPPVRCITHGGGILKVMFKQKVTNRTISISDVVLEGPVEMPFQGDVYI